MNNSLSFITQLQNIERQKQLLIEKENRLLTPLLTDLSDVQLVYGIFNKLMEQQPPHRLINKVEIRKKFMFVAICFFAPRTMAGHRLPHGFRAELTRVMNVYSSFVSNNIENVLFQFRNVATYRKELLYLYSEIENMLIISGKLDTLARKSVDS